jgi:hypothetical protein
VLCNIFQIFYVKKKSKRNLGDPTFANFKVFLQILAREFLLMNYNTIFLIEDLKRNRNNIYTLMVELAIENSKPAIDASNIQMEAMDQQNTKSL